VTDPTEKVERLFALMEKGAITRQQYEQQRDLLLATTSGPPPSATGDQSIPAQVGAYRILSPIGQGGMGAVYRGRHRSDIIADRQGGDVAIKVMHAQFARDPEFQARFEREASLGLKLDHPGIVKVHDLVMDAGTLALVMEHIEGRSLATVIGVEVGPIPWPRAWPMFEQLLEAVEYAHQWHVVHRDLKPDNVMVGPDGKLTILDFGIAKQAGVSGMTATGSGMGTVDYMAPEQHTDAKNVDERADVYALGMTLYEMLAGRLPWADEVDAIGVLHRKLSGDIPAPTEFYPDIPPEVVDAVMVALAAEPEGRFGSAEEFGRGLGRSRKEEARRHVEEAGRLAKQPGQEEEAEAQLLKAISKDPGNAVAHYGLGLLLERQPGRADEAKAHQLRGIEEDRGDAQYHNRHGLRRAEQAGREAEAEAHFRKAIDRDPAYADPHFNLGYLLAGQPGREDEAEAQYVLAIDKHESSPAACHNLGVLLARQPGREDEAEACLLTAIDRDPGHSLPHAILGRLLAKQPGREAEAEAHLLRAIDNDPTYARPHHNVGILLAKQVGREDEAEDHYLRAIDKDPSDSLPHHLLTFLLEKQVGREDEAEDHYLRAIDKDPSDSVPHKFLAYLLDRLPGREEDAEHHLREAARKEAALTSLAGSSATPPADRSD